MARTLSVYSDGSISDDVREIEAGAICRLKTDTELAEWNYKSRTDPANPRHVDLTQAPHTMRLNGGTGQTKLPLVWQEYVQAINSAAAFKYEKRKASGWVNQSLWPIIQELTFPAWPTSGLNLVKVTRVEGERAYISAYRKTDKPPATADPYRTHLFTVIEPDGAVHLPEPPGKAWVILISDAELWIEKHKLVRVS